MRWTCKNAEIIHELKKIMEEVSTRTSLRAHYCYAKNAFIRERILTLTCTVMLIINGLKCSLQVALPHCFEYFSQGLSCSRQAFCEQRVKWKPAFFHDLNQVPVSGFYRSCADRVKRWKGMVLWAVDGSSVSVPDTQEMRQIFGGVTG